MSLIFQRWLTLLLRSIKRRYGGIILDRPDRKGREQILGIHVKGKPLASNVDLQVVAKQTPGFVGADLENLVNEAAILAARRNKKQISVLEFQEAIENPILGRDEKRGIVASRRLLRSIVWFAQKQQL